MPNCVYCNREFNESDLTQEHVIPRGIGGNLTPVNPFSLRNVCRRCNSLCGSYIDGPFIKNWFTQNNRSESIYRFVNFAENTILPLRYMGPAQELCYQNRICEFWLGPTGDTIYHFHEPYPDEPDVSPMVGIPSYARRDSIDHGFVFIFIRASNPVWHPVILFSLREQFPHSIFYLGNGPTLQGGAFHDIPDDLRELHQQLLNMRGTMHHIRLEMDSNYGDRFLAKTALGLGAVLLNDTFSSSDSANLLRTYMWTRRAQDRRDIPLHGSGFLSGRFDRNILQFLSWPGGHFIGLMNDRNRTLNLCLNIFETQNAVIQISTENEHWNGIIDDEGIVYVISPGLQRCVGPIHIASFLSHRLPDGHNNPELQSLEEEMSEHSELPPFEIE